MTYSCGIFTIGLVLFVAPAPAQPIIADTTADGVAATQPPDDQVPEGDADQAALETDPRAWSFSAAANIYVVPDDHEYIQPTFTADRDWLHLEARHNYESLDTTSLWLGYNFSGGEDFTWEVTPMLGGVFGEVDGVAPGYKATLSWWKLEFYCEGEYVFDTNDSSSSFFYNWSELSLAPVEWARFGIVTQRTRLYESDREIERGLLVGCSIENVDLTAYVLNPDDTPTVVFAIVVNLETRDA